MAGTTRYHRLPEDTRPSLDSTGEDAHLLDARSDTPHDNPTTPKKKEFKYCFHPTIYLRFVAFALYLSSAIVLIISGRRMSVAAGVFAFIAMARQIWVLLHHILTQFIRVRVRIEFRESRSSITTKPKKRVPAWLLLGFVQVGIDVIVAVLALSTAAVVPHHNTWYYGETLSGKIVLFIAVGLHFFSAADLGQPSRLTFAGKVTFDKNDEDNDDEGNPPRLPIYRDVEATGAGGEGMQSRKTGADSPVII
ncbi:hypothetical protein VTL71DRAFT_6541 [Oculimacula yallundae]|uniref:Uncharacterized protein n=1 Tax=Oculimacula yallundae TaxID=86028 RepID=A0ABR4BX84_9HELO